MAGRPAKPIALHLQEGKKHLTKAEIEARKKAEAAASSGIKNFRADEKVMADPVALKVFKKLKKLYKTVEYVEAMDEAVINRYCIMTSEIDALEKSIARMTAETHECESASDRVVLYKTIASTQGALLRLRDMLLKVEDRMFLNPAARAKNVPRAEKSDAGTSKWSTYRGQAN
ncbi:MAG TPA: P27 family phage terminase small subunit [Clostridia bacterium]|nr:P27 family phage terminase small subunit [Clostridia bacterium]